MREGDRTKGIHRNPKKKVFLKKKKKYNVHNISHNFHKKLQVVGCN